MSNQTQYNKNRKLLHKQLGLCIRCNEKAAEGRSRCVRHLELNRTKISRLDRLKRQYQSLRDAAIKAYGGYICVCCNEIEPKFLGLDHINGGGNEQRRQASGIHFYRLLKKQNYPPGLQVLCHNCNQGRQLNDGICPHCLSRS